MFVIDTGGTDRPSAAGWRFNRSDALLDGAMDSLPIGATQEQADAAVLALILGQLHSPRLLSTVRQALMRFWPLLCEIAERDPDAFDEAIMAYAELSTSLPADRSEMIARRKASAAIVR